MYLVSRTETFAKLFFLLSFSGLVMYIVLAFYTFHTAYVGILKSERTKEAMRRFDPDPRKRFDKDFKYILLWTIPELTYNLTNDGQQLFISNNCSHLNCYLTTNKSLLDEDVSNYNAIVFNINSLKNWKMNMPTKRSLKQKYVFYSMVSADKFPVCNVKADGFFNWTWSYKLYSDIVTPFIEVRDLTGKVTAPKYGLNWTEKTSTEDLEASFDESTDYIVNDKTPKLGNKTKALMWYMHNCDVNRKVVLYVRQLKQALRELDLTFDIYGCAFKQCPEGGCFKALERDYYFYLAQEDSYSEDYVTTEVLKGYHHNAVPIVIGGARYSKFLPFNSYIDASHQPVDRLAALMQYTIRSPTVYRSYFMWKNLVTINEVNLQRGYCDLCAMLNDKKRVEGISEYKSFRTWWFYGSLKERCFPKGAERYDDILSYIKDGRTDKP